MNGSKNGIKSGLIVRNIMENGAVFFYRVLKALGRPLGFECLLLEREKYRILCTAKQLFPGYCVWINC